MTEGESEGVQAGMARVAAWERWMDDCVQTMQDELGLSREEALLLEVLFAIGAMRQAFEGAMEHNRHLLKHQKEILPMQKEMLEAMIGEVRQEREWREE